MAQPLPFLTALKVAWAIAPFLVEVLGDALADGHITPAERRRAIAKALNPEALEGLVEAVLAALPAPKKG